MPRYLDDGGWVPIDRRIVAALPRGRPYSEAEAMLSLSVDLETGGRKTVREYARLWHWGRRRVGDFLRRHLDGPEPDATTEASGEAKVRPRNFTYVAPLRRSERHGRGQQRSQRDSTTGETIPRDRPKRARAKTRKPWHGLTGDLDRLLACEAYVHHLTERSPVLASWTYAEIRAWARQVVEKGNCNRAARGEDPIRRYSAFLEQCVARVHASERPAVQSREEVPPEVTRAMEETRV